MTNTIVTGERLQELCDVYCGLPEDFHYNPVISKQITKHMDISHLDALWNNPSLILLRAMYPTSGRILLIFCANL